MVGRLPQARIAVTVLAAALPVAGLLVAVSGAAPALAAGPTPVCAAGTCTVSYATAGTGQSFTVPTGVTKLAVTMYGAAGGSATVYSDTSIDAGDTAAGGAGAEVTAQLAVTAGEVLGVDVGGIGGTATDGETGTVAGGINGGGPSAATDSAEGDLANAGQGGGGGGGGGGATDLATAPSSGTILLDAGGGGGAGLPAFSILSNVDLGGPCLALTDDVSGQGGNADADGATGATEPTSDNGGALAGGGGGSAGTTSGPGDAGALGALTGDVADYCSAGQITGSGTAGAAGTGSTGGTGPVFGGGGGGGYFGGGSGGSGAVGQIGAAEPEPAPGVYYNTTVASGGGGGGGASYIGGAGVSAAHITDPGNSGQINDGNGEAIISFADPIVTGMPSYTVTAGGQLSVPAGTGLLGSAAGTSAPPGDPLTATGPDDNTSANGGSVTVQSNGAFSYSPPAGFVGLDTFGYTVAGPAGLYAVGTASVQVLFASQSIKFTSSPPAKAQVGGHYTVAATGGGSGQPVTFSVPGLSAATCSVSDKQVSFTAAGTCAIVANQAGHGVYLAAPAVSQVIAVDQAPKAVLAAPGRSAAVKQLYGYLFAASGTPAPSYALATGAPTWLSINRFDGRLTGTPPAGTKSFSYSVKVSNTVGTTTAGPFNVTIGKPTSTANLRLVMSCPATLTVGVKKACTLTVTNLGPVAAAAVMAAIELPASLTELSCTAGCTAQANDYVWALDRLTKGMSNKLSVTFRAAAAGHGQFVAVVDSTTADSNTANNVATATVTIQP